MRIVFEPSKSNTNKYADILVSILESNGYEVYGLRYWFKHPSLWFQVRVIHLNWFENIIGRTKFSLIIHFIKQLSKLFFLKLFGAKIVWTMHNKTEHEKKDGALNLSNCLSRVMMRYSHFILIHCNLSREILVENYGISSHKIKYCPHPNYIEQYGPILEDNRSDTQKQELHLLFLGAVRPYKNIELLIESLQEINNRSIRLTIAGMPLNNTYEEKLLKMADRDSNIRLRFQFIKDDEIPLLISRTDIVVLPYEQRSSLNSGTLFLAFSYQKTVIIPEIGSVLDLHDEKNKIFHYSYGNAEAHRKVLKEKIEEAYNLFVREPHKLVSYGTGLFDYVGEIHRDQRVFEALNEVYTG